MKKKFFSVLLIVCFLFFSCKRYVVESEDKQLYDEIIRFGTNVEESMDLMIITLDKMMVKLEELETRIEYLESKQNP